MRVHFGSSSCWKPTPCRPCCTACIRCGRAEKDDEQEILYTTAVPSEQLAKTMQSGQTVLLEGGDYVQFNYEGPRSQLQDFILMLYGTCMPTLQLTRRRSGYRALLHARRQKRAEPPKEIRCEYLIPIVRRTAD